MKDLNEFYAGLYITFSIFKVITPTKPRPWLVQS